MKKPLYLRYVGVMIKGQLAKPSNLVFMALFQLMAALSVLFGLAVLFGRFKTLAGYGPMEVLLCFGLTHFCYSLAEMTARGFDMFSQVLAQGEFDRVLVRPRGPMFQVLATRLELSRLGRFAAGTACLAFAICSLAPGWISAAGPAGAAPTLAAKLLTLALMASGGYAIFVGIFVLGAALAFLSTDSLEIVNLLSDGGREISQYPLTIFDKSFRVFFTFIVPFGCVNYLPLSFVLGRPGSGPWACLLPLAGFLFLFICVLVWKAGAKRYVSTGS